MVEPSRNPAAATVSAPQNQQDNHSAKIRSVDSESAIRLGFPLVADLSPISADSRLLRASSDRTFGIANRLRLWLHTWLYRRLAKRLQRHYSSLRLLQCRC